jgi:DNA-binding transcriptional LysR family regulator
MALRFTLRQLEYFVAVGEAGSIALASEKVSVSSPSISAAISQLESEFGLQLFIRKHAHGLSLTQGGRQFLVQAKSILAAAEELNGLASDITGEVQGPLNVACLSTFAQLVLPQLRRKFETKFPRVRIKQSELHQAAIFERLCNAEIDVALTYDLDVPPDITFVPMLKLPLYAMLSIDHPLATHAQLSPEDLVEHPMVLLDLPFSAEYFLSFFRTVGLRPKVTERTRDLAVMRSLVANGYGYALANIRTISNLSPDGKRLKYIPVSGGMPALQLGVAYSKGMHMTPTVQEFVNHCAEVISSEDVPGLHVARIGGQSSGL